MSELKVKKNKRPLGKGLSQLLGDEILESEGSDNKKNQIQTLAIHECIPGKFQPRTLFDAEKLNALTASIKENGVLQPILVRPMETHYEIVAGERRWRASKAAGLSEIPVIIADFSDHQSLEAGLVENIQRDDLTPLEEAAAYKKLIETFDYSQDQLAQKISKSRSHIANTLRLLTLPKGVQEYLNSGELTAGHARVLIGHDNADEIAKRAIEKGLNVRQLEKLMQQTRLGETPANANRTFDPDKANIERQLSQLLGFNTKLKLNPKAGGVVEIAFKTMEDIDVLMQTLMKMRGYAA